MNECKQAQSNEQLIAEMKDSRFPKTEREHAAVREIERLEQRLAAAETAIRWMVGIYMVQDGLPDDVREYRTKKAIEFVMMAGKNLTILSREVKGE